MSKVYKCDLCGRIIDNPYKMKMKEFYVGCSFDFGDVFPENERGKVTIDLCKNCYKILIKFAKQKTKEELQEESKEKI